MNEKPSERKKNKQKPQPEPEEAFAKQAQAFQQDNRAEMCKPMIREERAIPTIFTKKNELLSASDMLVEAKEVKAV